MRGAGRIIRVFPRRTEATPNDELAFVGDPPFPELLPPADIVQVILAGNEASGLSLAALRKALPLCRKEQRAAVG